MVICGRCQQGFHLGCFGLATIPGEIDWECQGCVEFQKLAPGQDVVAECPQTLYGDGQDPHITQGLFKGTVETLGSI